MNDAKRGEWGTMTASALEMRPAEGERVLATLVERIVQVIGRNESRVKLDELVDELSQTMHCTPQDVYLALSRLDVEVRGDDSLRIVRD
ncbi:hypothetical protein [Kribbella speibonae]|uniref:Uncharacterized protein n=1 Tax=Kribbella speibonae TaxID=1572660 RepID=A0A4R0IC32_9ACTN|nr:hypothetical protein [Kribbella speibonae]TCC30683.1 hypothetical protein E0H92_36780 [Kribbella speibonae]